LSAFNALKGFDDANIYNMNSQEKYDPRSTYTVFDPVVFKHTFPEIKMDNWRDALKRCYADFLASGRDK
jgi:hypothetical protein